MAGDHNVRSTVLHLLPRDANRGAQHHARMLRERLRSSETDHLIATVFGSSNDHVEADVVLGCGERQHLRAQLHVVELLRSVRPNVCVAHGSEPLRFLALVPEVLRGPLVYHRIGIGLPQLHRPPRLQLHRFLTRCSDRIVAVSEAVAAECRSLVPDRSDAVTVIANGRDPDVFFPEATPPRRRPVAIFVGALTKEKRPDLFFEACEALGDAVEALVVGDGPLRQGLEERSAGTNIRVLGPRRDVPELLRRADIFGFTSVPFQEGMPGVLIEAAMSGLPIVATDVPGARDVVLDGHTGFIVPHGDTDTFARTFGGLSRDGALRRSMSTAAARHAQAFTLDRCATAWDRLVQEMLRT